MSVEEIIDEARAAVAAGGAPDWKELRDRIRALGGDPRDALRRLERVGAVHRARTTVTPAPAAPRPAGTGRRPPLLATKPTITGNMEVTRGAAGELRWGREPKVAVWEVRVGVRPDPRADYRQVDERELPGEATSVEVPLGDDPLRVHLLGRDRGGRLVRRAIVSGLTRETWTTRWQRRASAS